VLHASQGLIFTVESFHPRALSEQLPFGEFGDGELVVMMRLRWC